MDSEFRIFTMTLSYHDLIVLYIYKTIRAIHWPPRWYNLFETTVSFIRILINQFICQPSVYSAEEKAKQLDKRVVQMRTNLTCSLNSGTLLTQ